MMRKQLHVFVAVFMLLCCGAAKADVIYTYTGSGAYTNIDFSIQLSNFAPLGNTIYYGGSGMVLGASTSGISFNDSGYFSLYSGAFIGAFPISMGSYDPTKVGTYVSQSGEGILTVTQVSATPEPSSFLLMGTGVLGVGGLLRRRLAAGQARA